MPEVHAKLSPSAAERWFNCPGSVVLCDGLPEKSSPYAEEGTRAHKLAELLLTPGAIVEDGLFVDEMRNHVTVYVRDVRELASAPGAILHVEKQVHVTDQVWGTADAIVWDPNTKTLYVRDLKYGAGVPVEVSDNLQLKIYALAALLEMKYPAEVVNVGICQPRIPHPDGLVRSKDYDVLDLMDFHADLMEAVVRVNAAAVTSELRNMPEWQFNNLHPTEKGCRWCLSSPTCPKVKAQANEVAKRVFAPAVSYDPKELAHTLDFLPVLEAWIKNVREFAYGEVEQGREVPNYKLVEKRPVRKWKADVYAGQLAKRLGVEVHEVLKPAEMISPAEAEKLLPKDKRSMLDEIVSKESSGHTLVHESDKRPAARLDAKSVFSSEA